MLENWHVPTIPINANALPTRSGYHPYPEFSDENCNLCYEEIMYRFYSAMVKDSLPLFLDAIKEFFLYGEELRKVTGDCKNWYYYLRASEEGFGFFKNCELLYHIDSGLTYWAVPEIVAPRGNVYWESYGPLNRILRNWLEPFKESVPEIYNEIIKRNRHNDVALLDAMADLRTFIINSKEIEVDRRDMESTESFATPSPAYFIADEANIELIIKHILEKDYIKNADLVIIKTLFTTNEEVPNSFPLLTLTSQNNTAFAYLVQRLRQEKLITPSLGSYRKVSVIRFNEYKSEDQFSSVASDIGKIGYQKKSAIDELISTLNS